MTPELGTFSPETRHLNLEWTVADADQIKSMARTGYSAKHIAVVMDRTEEAVRKFCDQNGVFVRYRSAVRK
jgi:hypothetical protein